MVDVANMSDAELRTKLIEFGFPVMPITGTTRKVMEKKLKILMENKNTINNEGRRSLVRYSSEEESDADTKVTKRDKKRATMAAPPSRVTLRKSSRKVDNESDSETRRPILTEEKTMTSRTTKTTRVESGFDTGSDSESEIIESTYKNSNVNNYDSYKKNVPLSSTKSNISSSSYVENTRKYSPPKLSDDVVNRTVSYSSNVSPSRYTSYTSDASNYAADRLNQIRSRLSLGTSNYDRPSYTPSFATTTTSNLDKGDETAETPFLSNFTKRLSQLSTNPSLKLDDYKNDIIKEHDINGSGSFATKTFLSRPVKRDFTRDYHTGKQTNRQNNLVSFAVIGLAFLFFIVLGIAYLGLHNGQTAIEPGLQVTYCSKVSPADPTANCVLEAEIRDAVKFFQTIKPELNRVAIENRCSDWKVKPYLTEKDVIRYVERKSSDNYDPAQALKNVEILILNNPQWEVSLLKITDNVLDETPIKTSDELFDSRDSNTIALSILEPSLPWTCSLYKKLTTIVQTLLVLGVGFAAVYSVNTGYKYYKHYVQKQKDELFYMIERIIDILQSSITEDGDNFLVINHVRDMILPINDRARMEKTWRKAVDFINKNESRVRTELQVVQGEPYEVWRWLGSPSWNTSGGSPRNKSWQGQAFETQVGSVNSLPCSPTPCLKIRGMVDEGDRNLHTIREAVLSKCTHQCKILHCAVDTNSKCVYLKCADQNDAAVAYRSLHGWWYAGNLVTVKYLRLERYMQRYPDSPVSGPPYLKAVQPATDWSN